MSAYCTWIDHTDGSECVLRTDPGSGNDVTLSVWRAGSVWTATYGSSGGSEIVRVECETMPAAKSAIVAAAADDARAMLRAIDRVR